MKKILFALIFTITSFSINAQILNDNESKQLIIKGLDKIYNYEFKEGEAILQKVKAKYPNHPVTPLLTAVQIQWQNLDIAHNPKIATAYKQNLDRCLELSEKMVDDKDKFPEAVFFLLTAHGYTALTYTYTKEYLRAANEARKAYGYIKDGFKLTEKNPEFYATTGLYNYYIEQYPETHPMVKPALIFFADGNKKLGLDYLELAAKKSLFSKIEAIYYLAHIYLKYENQPAKSLIYSTLLTEKYPDNPIFLMRNVEGLVLAGKYEEAIPKIEQLFKNPDKVYQIAANVFEGIVTEKYKKNDKLAATYYWTAFKYQQDERFTKNYHAMAYAGIARIYNRTNNKEKAKEYYSKCLDIAEYKALIQEAKAFK